MARTDPRGPIPHLKPRSDIGKPLHIAHHCEPKQAYEKGYRYVVISPKGNPVSFHRDEKSGKFGLAVVRGMGCSLKPLESLL